MLAATIAAAFNTLQIILVARNNPPRGLGFLDYLVLQEGSGFRCLERESWNCDSTMECSTFDRNSLSPRLEYSGYE
jgi:hypothetical protein